MDIGVFLTENGAALFWLFVAIAAAVTESMTCDLVALWFVPGALAAMLLSMFVDSAWWQIALFLALSVVTLLLAKTVFKKYMPQSKTKNRTNADALIGTHGIVQEEIDNLCEKGSVKVKALVWTARSIDDTVKIPAGTIVTVCDIAGVKLICKPQIETEPETENKNNL